MGRKTKLTPERQDKIVQLIRAGNFANQAALAGGISEATYYNWLKQGEIARSRKERGERLTASQRSFLNFLEAIKGAEAEAEARNVALIQQAAQSGTWQAAAWFLERKHATRWGRKDTTKLEATVNKAEVDLAELSDEELAILLQQSSEE